MERILIDAKIIINTSDVFKTEDQRHECILRLERFLNTMEPIYLEQKLYLRFHFNEEKLDYR